MQIAADKPRILIVEDEYLVVRHLELELSELGYQPVAHANTGEKAVELAGSLRPDLVLMDIQLAGAMNGIEAAQLIRSQLDIPVVFLTAFAEEGIIGKAKLTEPFGYILKPFSDRDLHAILEMALYKHKTEVRLKNDALYNQFILDNMADAIIVTDANGVIKSLNNLAPIIFDYAQDELIGQNILLLVAKSHHSQYDDFFGEDHCFKNENTFDQSREFEGQRKDGSLFPISLRMTQSTIGDKTTFIVLVSDISQRKKAETILLQAKQAAETINKTKSQFLASMSHEIRTPINGVLGLTQLLAETSLDEKQKKLVNTILTSGNALMTILNDILDMSKMEAGKMEIEYIPFQPREVLRDVIDVMNVQAIQKGISLRLHCVQDIPHFVRSDSTRIRQILFNLIGNAIKFTSRGSVDVALNIVQKQLYFEVKDTGIGIAEEKHSALFQMFTQENASTSRTFGGTGLGLAITKQLVTLMGGDIGFESEKNVGSLFWVKLPLLTVSDSAAINYVSAQNNLQPRKIHNEFAGCRVLLVDDNDINLMVAGGMLKTLGLEFDVAHNGEEAIEKVFANSYNVVLMDCEMPVLDGYEATREIRRREKALLQSKPNASMAIAIVALTANAMSEDKQRCIDSGMDGFITKPLKMDGLHSIMAEYIFNDPRIDRRKKR